MTADPAGFDYIVVGSGAGGGTLAARLAELGMRVLLLEAGGDARTAAADRLPEDYDVPAFHPFASENPEMSWDFFVRHYADDAAQARDPKADGRGVLYPRAGTLGGCTAHNAMIFVRPPDSDWDAIAKLTGDTSWRASAMQVWLQRLEACRHRPEWRLPALLGLNPTGHGWRGWLPTERAKPAQAWSDHMLIRTIAAAALGVALDGPGLLGRFWRLFRSQADPNDQRMLAERAAGLFYTPLSTDRAARVGTRERVLDVAARLPDRLHVETDALATGVMFDAGNRAIGVSYLKGRKLYRAGPGFQAGPGEMREIRARREVILCGGAFNTPQLLMLSGIGPAETLARHAIPVRVDLPGVGRNLQDRYEVAVVNRMKRDWTALRGARFERGDPVYSAWKRARTGMYMSNGAAFTISRRSAPDRAEPDLFCMALLARFAGYFPGYSREIAAHHDYLSWAVLKAHTNNRAGEVTLRSADPRDPPLVNFHYFNEGSDDGGDDLQAVVDGIRFVRRAGDRLRERALIAEEELPGALLQSDEELAAYVRDTAWGHHASCSCAIGKLAEGGVLDSRFRVYGVTGLRVVDASIFPRIPGFFIAAAIYIAAEKAANTILRDAATGRSG